MICRKLVNTAYSTAVATLSIMLLVSQVLTSLTAKEVVFTAKGHVLKNTQLFLLQVTLDEVNFDQKGFSVSEVNDLLLFLNEMHPYAIPLVKFNESDITKYSLMLRFAHSLNSKPLFEFVARDFYYLLGMSVLDFISIIPGMRSATFEPILFRVYLGLSSQLSLEQRVEVFSFLINSVRPDFYALEEFFSFEYKVIQVGTSSKDYKVTEWTVEIDGQFQTSFFIGNYDSEDWHLKFVDGNLHFELAKFLVTNATTIGHSNMAILFFALDRREIITSEERDTALLIAFDYEFIDAMKALKETRLQGRKPSKNVNVGLPALLPNRKRKRTNGRSKKPRLQKKRRTESTSSESGSVYFQNVEQFHFRFSSHTGYLKFRAEQSRLFIHLKENLGSSLKPQKGKLKFTFDRAVSVMTVNFPDLSYEAVKSFLEVDQRGLLNDRAPPTTKDYELATEIPKNEEEKKELMIQVAQMVCVAIRVKFDEEKFFTLLDWYKARMQGVWEELLQSGNKFVKEVDEVRKDCAQTVQDSAGQNIVQEKLSDDETSLQHLTDDVTMFKIVPENLTSLITVQEETGDLFPHLKERLWKLKVQQGKMEFDIAKGKYSKRIELPDLSLEAVKSYVVVTTRGLQHDNGPPKTCTYQLRKITENEEEKKELMIQVAQMVCAAIRFKFEEEKLLTLLDWYKERMEGVWEELLKSGNKFVKEVEEFRDSIIVAQLALADDQSVI